MHAHFLKELDSLSMKLHRVQTEYERARFRGDADRIYQFRLQMSAIVAERDRLMGQQSHRDASGYARPLGR